MSLTLLSEQVRQPYLKVYTEAWSSRGDVQHKLAMQRSMIHLFFLNSDSSTSLWSLPDVAGDLDSQTIEVLASWMLEHPLTEEQQAAESPRLEGAPDTPSPDGPETVQCPERPTSQPSERSEISETFSCWYWHWGYVVNESNSLIVICCYFVYSLLPGLDWIERENFLDVHLTRNRPPPARRRRSGPTQRTSFRRAGQCNSCDQEMRLCHYKRMKKH